MRKITLVIIAFLCLPIICFGQVFPKDAVQTYGYVVYGGGSTNLVDCAALPSGVCTVLYWWFAPSGQPDYAGQEIELACADGSFQNSDWAKAGFNEGRIQSFEQLKCDGYVNVSNNEDELPPFLTGVIYVPYNIASSTNLTGFYGGASSSIPSTFNGFTYGEIIIAIFSFLTFMVLLYAFIFGWLRGFKIKQ